MKITTIEYIIFSVFTSCTVTSIIIDSYIPLFISTVYLAYLGISQNRIIDDVQSETIEIYEKTIDSQNNTINNYEKLISEMKNKLM